MQKRRDRGHALPHSTEHIGPPAFDGPENQRECFTLTNTSDVLMPRIFLRDFLSRNDSILPQRESD